MTTRSISKPALPKVAYESRDALDVGSSAALLPPQSELWEGRLGVKDRPAPTPDLHQRPERLLRPPASLSICVGVSRTSHQMRPLRALQPDNELSISLANNRANVFELGQ